MPIIMITAGALAPPPPPPESVPGGGILLSGDQQTGGAPPDLLLVSGDAQSGSPASDTEQWSAEFPGPPTDPFFDSVVLLTHLNLGGGSPPQPPVDESASAHTLTLGAGASRDTTNKKFGTASYDLSAGASNTKYIQAPNSADFDYGAGDWTNECFVRFANLPSATSDFDFLSRWSAPGGTDNCWFCWMENRHIQFTYATTNSNFFTLDFGDWSDVAADQWYHLAWCRDGNNLRMFIDGVQFGATKDLTGKTFWNSSQVTRIGERLNGGAGIDGQVDEVRLTKGVARYTANFTPPTEPFPDQ